MSDAASSDGPSSERRRPRRRARSDDKEREAAREEEFFEEGEAPGGSYEFTHSENQTFLRLGGAMGLVAYLMFAIAAVMIVPAVRSLLAAGGAMRVVGALAAVVVPLVLGVWTLGSAGHLRRVADTKGDDIRHLMEALAKLSKLFAVQMWLCFATLALALWFVLATMFFGQTAEDAANPQLMDPSKPAADDPGQKGTGPQDKPGSRP